MSLRVFTISDARALILLDTGVPSVNTTAPGGSLTNSGWQYEGQWGGFLGTPIAPHFFVSAAHIGQAGSNLIFQGSTYMGASKLHPPARFIEMVPLDN